MSRHSVIWSPVQPGPSDSQMKELHRRKLRQAVENFELCARTAKAALRAEGPYRTARFSSVKTLIEGYSPAFSTHDGINLELDLVDSSGERFPAAINKSLDRFTIARTEPFLFRLPKLSQAWAFSSDEPLINFIRLLDSSLERKSR